MGRQLGYSGKMCVVPRQIEIANQVFSPSAEEVDWSRRLIDAYEKAQGAGRGSFEFDGRMVDEPLLKRAEPESASGKHAPGVYNARRPVSPR